MCYFALPCDGSVLLCLYFCVCVVCWCICVFSMLVCLFLGHAFVSLFGSLPGWLCVALLLCMHVFVAVCLCFPVVLLVHVLHCSFVHVCAF